MKIPYGRQEITPDDIAAVVSVLESDFLTQGPKVGDFETAITTMVGAAHGIAVNSATSALHIACLALGVGRSDIVWTSPISFVASANCAALCGASIDFVDIDLLTFNISTEALEHKLRAANVMGKLPKVLIVVHMCGQSCDMERIYGLTQQYGVSVIEDASHAIGGTYKGKPIGNCNYSDITVFSFHPVKLVTTGEGGIAVTNDPRLASTMTLLRSHGVTRNPLEMKKESEGPWYYEQISLGLNYRMTDVQAALGLSQLGRLDQYIEKRNFLAKRYDEKLIESELVTPYVGHDCRSAFHLYVIRVLDEHASKNTLFTAMLEAGIGVNVHYRPIYRQPYYASMGFIEGYCPVAERYYREAMTLPLFPTMTTSEQDFVIETLCRHLS